MIDVSALYEQHASEIRAYCGNHMRGAAAPDAEDVAASVWERALKAAGRYRDDGKPRAWLFTIASRLVSDYHRRRRCSISAEQIGDEALQVDEPRATREYRRVVDRMVLAPALDTLTPWQRDVVARWCYAGEPASATASAIGTTENAVMKARHRALASLRRSMEVRS